MTQAPARWEHFDHGADIGIRGVGPTPAIAFEQAALALTAVVCSPDDVRKTIHVTISCSAMDLEGLFVEWLNQLIYEMATRKVLFSRYQVELNDNELEGSAWGEAIDVSRHQPAVEIKGATYTALGVRQNADGDWIAQTVVDV